MSGTLNVLYELCMMSLKSDGGISSGEMNWLKISKASSWKEKSRQSFCQLDGREGISSGM